MTIGFTTTNISSAFIRNGIRSAGSLSIFGLAVVAAVALTGCGGSSGGGSSASSTPVVVRTMPTNTFRTMLNGDRIQYSVTGKVNTTTLSGSATNTITLNASPVDPNGNKQTVSTTTINVTSSTGTPVTSTSNAYRSQDSTGTVFNHGNSVSGWITTPNTGFVTALVSPIVSPYSWVQTFTNQNGDFTTETISVGVPVAVTTSMGTFDSYTYTIDSTQTLAAGGKSVGSQVSYVVPDIGAVKVAITLTQTAASGTVTTSQFNLSMSGTNIAYP